MQYCTILDCKNYKEINQDIIRYLHTYTKLLVPNKHAKYCNFVSTIHFIQNNPKLENWFISLNLKLRDVYFTLTWKNPIPIHVDKPPVEWKLNWPVLHTEKSFVRFFKANKEGVIGIKSGDPNSKDNDNTLFNYNDFDVIEKIRFNKPIIMNGLVQHDAWIEKNAIFPRIGLQCMFFNEPTHLIKKQFQGG